MSGRLRLTLASMIATVATCASLAAVFASNGWALPVIGAVVLVSASCAAVRWSPLPSLFEPLVAAIVVTLWVTWRFASQQAVAGVIPNGAALSRLDTLARNGFTDIHKLPAPVPTHDGLVLITVIGVAVVALLVDLLTVTVRRAALAGLPLLALYTLCAASSHRGVNAFGFIAAGFGFLVLLYVDSRERVNRWGTATGASGQGRPTAPRTAGEYLPAATASLGSRIGVAAISISVVVPLIIPGVHSGFHGHGNGGSGDGGGSVTTIDPIVSVDHDLESSVDAPVLSYRTSTSTPGYLRMTSLDNLSEGSFTASALNAPVSARVTNGLGVLPSSTQRITTSITVRDQDAFRWLPMPATTLSVTVPGDWRYDPTTATAFSASDTTQGLSYTVVSSPNLPTPSELAQEPRTVAATMADDLAHSRIDPQVRTLTQQIINGANSSYDAALDIQRYLTSSLFSYNPEPPAAPAGTDPLTFFLLHSRTGFCQQFATAMAVMARLAGIPSRVAVGFTAGAQQPDGSYLVTTHDAHAWPELYFPDYGWLPFEPTPRGDGQAVAPSYARAAPNTNGGPDDGAGNTTANPTPTKLPSGAGNHQLGGGGGGSKSTGSTNTSGSGVVSTLLLILAGLVVLAGITPATARQVIRRRRALLIHGKHSVPAAWAELRDSAIDVGAPWTEGTSPRQVATALNGWFTNVQASPTDSSVHAALIRLARAEERERYAADPGPFSATLAADLRVLRTAMRRQASTSRWIRSALLPPSTIRSLTGRVS
ncbi:MAG TPA: DUF3488 and transglutaminase-like domain-containing protein [Mycobacteriales bacterium]|jgi:transglutaminase-like putative cysteine protease|nr:DUF3488 and transglutaminase-like domain-containing protein [Mycobacteriales bacterium]